MEEQHKSEMMRLKAEAERKDVLYDEALAKERSRHMLEEKTLKDTLHENEMQSISARREITQLKDKQGRIHDMRSQEHEETVGEMKRKFEREQSIMQEENRRLQNDNEKVRM